MNKKTNKRENVRRRYWAKSLIMDTAEETGEGWSSKPFKR